MTRSKGLLELLRGKVFEAYEGHCECAPVNQETAQIWPAWEISKEEASAFRFYKAKMKFAIQQLHETRLGTMSKVEWFGHTSKHCWRKPNT